MGIMVWRSSDNMKNRFYGHSREVMAWSNNGSVSMVIGSSDDIAIMKGK